MTMATQHFESPSKDMCIQSIVDAKLRRAEEFLSTDLVSAAAEIYQAILDHAENATARYGLARCAFMRADLHESLGHLQMLQGENQTAEVVNDMGVIYYQLGLSDDAIETLEEAVRMDPSYSVAWRNLADIELSLGQDEECRSTCARWIEIDPNAAVGDILAQLA